MVRTRPGTSLDTLTDTPGEGRRRRVVVALHEGLYGAESGTGFSNRAFLTTLARLLPAGSLSVIAPHVPESAGAHDPRWASEVKRTLERAGADVFLLRQPHAPADSVHGFTELCAQAGAAIGRIARAADRCLTVGLDVPFLGLAGRTALPGDVLLVPRSSAALTRPRDLSRVRWEREVLRRATRSGAQIGAISTHMRGHLITKCGVPSASIVNIPNGLIQEEMARPVRQQPLPLQARAGFLLSMGRAVPTKGFEDLLEALGVLRARGIRVPHLVLAAVTSDERERLNSYQEHLAACVRTRRLNATLITRFTPSVRAWLHSPALRAVIVPSREEPFGRVPLEAFAAGAGPVIATTAGGLAQTVIDGETGFTAVPQDPKSLADALHRALTARPGEIARMRNAGAAMVRSHHDYERTIASAMARVAPWALASSPTGEGHAR